MDTRRLAGRGGFISGFTLVEILIVLVIVALLSSVALPAYNRYVVRGRIPEATAALSTKRVQMEQFFQDNRTYAAAPAGALDSTTSNFFNFSALDAGGADTRSASGYTLRAVGKGAMAGFVFSVDQANAKASTVTGVSGWSGSTTCWVTRPGGVC